MRASGILMPITSISSNYGIGCFSKEAYEFVDALKKAGQRYWQILPIGPTGYGDSPYQSFSTFAGNPYFIDLEDLINKGWITKEECDGFDFGDNEQYVDYEKIYNSRFKALKIAFDRSNIKGNDDFEKFKAENSHWLADYSLYMAIKNFLGGISWSEWDNDIKFRNEEVLNRYRQELSDEIEFYNFQQYMFDVQWKKLKEYANNNGVYIIGDIPIYVARDSSDTWANPELFQFDENRTPIKVAGCPPDAFSSTGQLWGNPLYDWEYHKNTGYEWWIKRMRHCFKLYDVVRVDHFRGFDEYYAIPFGDETAEFGSWQEGPRYALFEKLKQELGDMHIIAEDLGFLTDTVLELVAKTGYPGMKVLEFAFDSREGSDYLPYNYPKNSVVYTGTHDNEPIMAWFENTAKKDVEFAQDYMNNKDSEKSEIHWDFIRLAFSSVSNYAIIPMVDILGLGNEARINEPSTLGKNWKWRIKKGEFTDEIIEKLLDMTKLYGRLVK